MPIHINLLAEAQAAEDLRRRDPVKRAWLGGSFAVALVLVWCLTVQARIMRANSEYKGHEARWNAMEKKHTAVTDDLKNAAVVERKLDALDRLSTNRFLWGSTLNALQQTVVNQVQAVRLKTVQTFSVVEPVLAKTSAGKTTPGKPAEAIEKIMITVEAKDWNPVQQNYNKYKEAIAKFPAFQTNLAKADSLRLTSLSKPSYDPSDPVRAFVLFTLEMQFPEIHRHE